ncbi:MAG: SpoIVB peptidase [Clostridiales bacterium]|nr:SpoIVB peptidase [Clostridiales bacterium]
MEKFQNIIRQITYLGFFLVAMFAVKSFHDAVPDKIYVKMGEELSYDFDVPVSMVLKEESKEVFETHTGSFDGAGEEYPSYTVTCKLFGIFPVKDVEVMLVEPESVYVNGMPIGIYVKTQGVLIIGTGEVETKSSGSIKPAENLVKKGDYIVSINGEKVEEKEELVEKINEFGQQKEVLGVIRDDEYIEVSVMPAKSSSGKYMLGIWVRDDLAGVGTLTYYKQDGNYGALGHAVSDGETGTIMDMEQGWIYHTNIIGIRKGENGNPGELSGVIEYRKNACLGTVEKNTPLGIYGKLDGNLDYLPLGKSYEVTYKQDIHTGTAYVLSAISGETKSYEITIESLDYSDMEENKGILFKVTDPELLELTGGIVQGMSGSPIIQNGKIIGAVTHVFVSDSTRGYGIFIEKMLKN